MEKLLLKILIIIIKYNFLTEGKLLVKNQDADKWYYQYLEKIIKDNIDPNKLTICVDCNEIINDLSKLIPLVTINKDDGEFQWYMRTEIAACILDLTENAKRTLRFLENMPGWNPRAKYFIFFNDKKVHRLLEVLFSKYIVNVVIFKMIDNVTIEILTYFPFKNGELRPKSVKSSVITTIQRKEPKLDRSIDLFPNKYPKRWKNAVVDVGPVYLPPYIMCPRCEKLRGLEFLLLRAVEKRLNISLYYPSSVFKKWGYKMSNGTYAFAFAALRKQKYDMVAGAFFPSIPEYYDFDVTYPHMEDYYVIVIPTATIQPRWRNIVQIFKIQVWITILMIQLLLPAIFYLFSFLYGKGEYSEYFLKCFSILLKIPIAKMPRMRAQRCLLIMWIIYSILMDTYFESHLQGALNMPHRRKQIESTNKLEEIGAKISVSNRVKKFFENSNTDIDQFVQRNHFLKPEEEILSIMANEHNNSAILLERLAWFHISRNYVDDDGTSKLYISSKVLSLPINFYYVKGFPLLYQFENILTGLRTSGYITGLYSYAFYKDLSAFERHATLKSASFSLNEFKSLLGILFTGLFFATIILGLEIFWHRFF